MAVFEYKARNRTGNIVTGTLEAETESSVASQLDILGYFPVSIRKKPPELFHLSALKDLLSGLGRVKHEDFILLNRQMATLIASGIPFIRCLDAVAEQTESKKLKRVLEDVRFKVESGSSFSDSIAEHPDVFSDLYINMIRAGEEGGMLEVIMERLATLAEHDAMTRSRIKAATRYPLLVVFAIVAAFIALMWLVVPQFVKIFEKFQAELPLPTRMLIAINNFFKNYWIIALIVVAASLFLIWKLIRTGPGRNVWHRIKLRLPVFGVLFNKVAISRFTRIFGSLIATGIPILQTLDIASKTVGNVHIEKIIIGIRDSVREGESLAAPMGMSGVFPPIVVQMVAVGEESGRLDEMLVKVSEYFDMEVEFAIRNLTTALEPLLILFIGGVILFLALAIFLPWWNLINVIR